MTDSLSRLSSYRLIRIIFPYFVALLLTTLLTAVFLLLPDVFNTTVAALLYLLPVGLGAFFGGLGPGIFSAILAFLAFNYYFTEPFYTFLVYQPQDVLELIVLLFVAVVISQLVGRTRHSLAVVSAREREAVQLYELSAMLSGLNNEHAIAHALSERILEALQADQVGIFLDAHNGNAPLYFQLPVGSVSPTAKPDILIPLNAVQGLLGEIRFWRSSDQLSEAEERLLRTFASQAVLALERARLTQTETRTRILEESDRFKTSLLSSVSHELRTPLATIKAAVTGLSSQAVDWDSEARTELLAVIEEESDELDRLVGNLLNMSRIEAGALKPQRKWNHLKEIVEEVVNRLSRRSTSRKTLDSHHFEIDISEDLPLVPVDYFQMEQVFTNLLSNSLKYSPPGSTIRIRASQVDPVTMAVQVTNQGPGVPEEHLECIFDKFYRVTAADRVTGAGLGLSICKGIIDAHGGRIWAENLPDGFAFNFTLPLTWEGGSPHIDI